MPDTSLLTCTDSAQTEPWLSVVAYGKEKTTDSWVQMVLDAGSAVPVVFVPSTAWARPLVQTDSSLIGLA